MMMLLDVVSGRFSPEGSQSSCSRRIGCGLSHSFEEASKVWRINRYWLA